MPEFFSDETMSDIAEAQMRVKQIVRRYDMLSRKWHPRSQLFREIQRELAKARLNEDPFPIKEAVQKITESVAEGTTEREAAFPLITPGLKESTLWADTLRDILIEEGEDQYSRGDGSLKSLFSSKWGNDRTPGEKKAWKKFNDLQKFSLTVKDDLRALNAKLKKIYLRAEREYTSGN